MSETTTRTPTRADLIEAALRADRARARERRAAQEAVDALTANADALLAGTVDYPAFDVAQKAEWGRIAADGLAPTVRSILRGR